MRKKSPPTSKYTKGIASLATPKDEEFKEISTLLQQGLSSHRSGLLLEAIGLQHSSYLNKLCISTPRMLPSTLIKASYFKNLSDSMRL